MRIERQAADVSLGRLAALSGMSKSALGAIERGVRSPTWTTVTRVLTALGREPVLDTRPMDSDQRASAEPGATKPLEALVRSCGRVLDEFEAGAVRYALDGENAVAAYTLQDPGLRMCLAVPREDREQLYRALNRRTVLGWSERFRDYRHYLDEPEQLDAQPHSRWQIGPYEFCFRLVDDWRPLVLVFDDRTIGVLPIEDLRQDSAVARRLKS